MPDNTELNPPEPAVENSTEGMLAQSEEPRERVAELEDLIKQKDQEIALMSARILEFEQTITGLESEITALKQVVAESNGNVDKLSENLKQAVSSYRALVVQANPGVPEELITGDSIEAITDSLEAARTLVSKIRNGMEAEISLVRVPVGTPERTAPDLSGLSPREKIQYAVGGFSS